MLQHIYTQVQRGQNDLLREGDTVTTGVVMRVEGNHYRRYPLDMPELQQFQDAVHGLRAVISVKLHNASVSAALLMIGQNDYSIFVGRDTRVQVLDTLADLPLADREQCAAFIRDEHALVLWAQQVDDLLPLYEDFDRLLLRLVMEQWRSQAVGLGMQSGTATPALSRSLVASTIDVSGEREQELKADPTTPSARHSPVTATVDPTVPPAPPPPPAKKRRWFARGDNGPAAVDLEKGKLPAKRPTQLYAPVYGGLATGLTIFFIGCGVNVLLQEAMLDGTYIRFALLLVTPLVFCVALFFSCQLVSNVFFCVGPVKQYHENSKYYSAIAPVVDPDDPKPDLPHVTIQMPVYKESLELVIRPSVDSLKKAMLTYARQGGTCSIVICDDGLQLLSEEDRAARIQFYADQGIGWTARPKHSSAPGAYQRAGRFKKASNLNSSLQICRALEVHIARIQAEDPNGFDIEERALEAAVAEKNAELDERYMRPAREKAGEGAEVPKIEMWARNAKALRIGAVILIVDSDTQVPTDCLRDAALELAESPEVAIIQHESDVMQVAHHWFENGIAHFTRRINRCISMGCANGEVAPFVGHNAFLRWKAVQEVAFVDPDDGVRKIWSESNVSEDFDMALRLQLKGYIIRWATYSNGGFKEGVSLTVDDELNRWQKYAYGCSELMFYPLRQWFKKGPLQPQLHKFIWSNVPLHSKLTTLSYIFSYYGIAGAVVLSLLNYILVGFTLDVDGFYVRSWEVWIACSFVFIGTGNVAFTLLEYRIGKVSLRHGAWLTIKWIPFFFFFFGGLSWPLTTALLSHLFSYNIQWSATVKEVELSNFFVEVPRIFKLFWRTFLMSFLLIATVIIMSTSLVPSGWRIVDYAVIFPLAMTAGAHVLFPIALNPWLMIFSY
ncbi:hypothetical protein AURDEDRAFT_115793 [Auricularia subglabra TFB-10046 SS5]|nr:hypothetical protein AURDEDRAFT_115793 [Auricularia subglabra TFB-10046 SS5]